MPLEITGEMKRQHTCQAQRSVPACVAEVNRPVHVDPRALGTSVIVHELSGLDC